MAKIQTPTTATIGGLEITMFSGTVQRVTGTRENGITCQFCKKGDPFRQKPVARFTRDQVVLGSDLVDSCVVHLMDAVDLVHGSRAHVAQHYR